MSSRKTFTIVRSFVVTILLSAFAAGAVAQEPEAAPATVVVEGTVKDRASKKKLANVSVFVPGTRIGTVSNADGSFSLKIPADKAAAGLKAEQVGYFSSVIPLPHDQESELTIWLRPSAKTLKELVVRSGDPRVIVEEALRKVPQNYSSEPQLYSAFYRETIQKRKRYVGITEGMVSVYKTGYKRQNVARERVGIRKGRRLMSQNSKDTIAVKILGGPTMPVVMDFIKNREFLFTDKELDYYQFQLDNPTSIDDRLQFVVKFRPTVKVDYPLFEGVLYIDQESLAISRAEFELDMSDKSKATRAILRQKPTGLHFKPQEVSFVVTYRDIDGVSSINYMSSKMRFKCDWKRRLFSSGFTTYAEMVVVDREEGEVENIPRKQAFGKYDIFYDQVDNYRDPDFWRDYNIIEPTESLETAVEKLLKQSSI